MRECLLGNHVKTNKPIGLIFFVGMANISEYNIPVGVFTFRYFTMFEDGVSFMVTAHYTIPVWIHNPLNKENRQKAHGIRKLISFKIKRNCGCYQSLAVDSH